MSIGDELFLASYSPVIRFPSRARATNSQVLLEVFLFLSVRYNLLAASIITWSISTRLKTTALNPTENSRSSGGGGRGYTARTKVLSDMLSLAYPASCDSPHCLAQPLSCIPIIAQKTASQLVTVLCSLLDIFFGS